MKKILLASVLLVGSLSISNAAEWYQGGTLHNSTMGEWEKAKESNKLATCADWVSSLYLEKKYNPQLMNAIETFGEVGLKEMSNSCVQMLDAASSPETASQKTIEMYVFGAALAGWLNSK